MRATCARKKIKERRGQDGGVHLTFPINLRGTSVPLAAERHELFGNNADYFYISTDREALLTYGQSVGQSVCGKY